MDITIVDEFLKKVFKKTCHLIDNSPSFYTLEFSDPFTICEFEKWADVCKKFLSQYHLRTGATFFSYSKTFHKRCALQLYKLPLEKILEALTALNKDLNLQQAILLNDPKEAINVLLDDGAQVNSKDITGETPLHRAVKKGDNKIIQLLLKKGALINEVNSNGETALHLIAKTLDLTTLEKLLATPGIDIHAKDNEGNICLYSMAFLGKQEMLEKLYQAGIPIDTVNNYGETPLFSAIYGINPLAVKFFLERGASVNHQSVNGTTPLIAAVLLAAHHSENFSPAMHTILTTLLNVGADPMMRTLAGESALQIADKANNVHVGKLLIDTVLSVDLMTVKPYFQSHELSSYWDISVQKLYYECLEKSLENGMQNYHMPSIMPFFSKTQPVYEIDSNKRSADHSMSSYTNL